MAIPQSVTDEKDIDELAEKVQGEFDKAEYGAGTGGYSGKKPASGTSKTVKNIRQQVIGAAANHSRQDIEKQLATDLKHLLNYIRHKPQKKDYRIELYLKWLNESIGAKSAVWNESEIEVEQFGARGPGGQNVNKSEEAVRCIHMPSMIKAMNQDSRDMKENRVNALEVLKSRLDLHFVRWTNYLHSFHGDLKVTPELFWEAVTKDSRL